jgi:hypothetical protein
MNINKYLASRPESDFDYGPEFQRLLDATSGVPSDTTAAARLWERIACGEEGVVETLLWAQHVANAITKSVVNSRERDAAPAALKAIGFYGRVDPYRDAKWELFLLLSFDELDEHGNPIPRKRPAAAECLRVLKKGGYMLGIPEKTALNRISEWLRELGLN